MIRFINAQCHYLLLGMNEIFNQTFENFEDIVIVSFFTFVICCLLKSNVGSFVRIIVVPKN